MPLQGDRGRSVRDFRKAIPQKERGASIARRAAFCTTDRLYIFFGGSPAVMLTAGESSRKLRT
jgi:hypothetical protein